MNALLALASAVTRLPGRSFGPFDLSLQAGERIAVLGPSGAGKSTLLKLMAGERTAHGGTATLLIELPDAQERRRRLPQLNEAAHRIYVDVAQQPRVFAQANEDLIDRHLTRLSAVHFLRFQFREPSRAAVLSGATVTLGCAHDQYAFRRVVPPATMTRLRRDLVPAPHQNAAAQVMPSPAPITA